VYKVAGSHGKGVCDSGGNGHRALTGKINIVPYWDADVASQSGTSRRAHTCGTAQKIVQVEFEIVYWRVLPAGETISKF
jgi:hypothetical protein